MNRIEIHPETSTDIDDIRTINVEAFRDHPVSRQTEHLIVDSLRASGALDVSLAAVSEGRTVGHIAFSKACVGQRGVPLSLCALGADQARLIRLTSSAKAPACFAAIIRPT